MIDSFATGVCMVGAKGEILHANAAASSMLLAGRPIRKEKGCLRGSEELSSKLLLEAIEAAQQDEAGMGACGIGIPLAGPGRKTAVAHVLPLARGNIRTRLVPQSLAAVFINTAGVEQFLDLDAVAKAMGFTTAEKRLVEQLLLGNNVVEAAAATGVKQSTSKTHLKHIFQKVGVYRQAELLTLMNRLVTPIRRPASPAAVA